MKQISLLLILIFSSYTYSQDNRIKISGKVKSDSLVIEGAHIINLTAKVGTISGANGMFEIPVKMNDTILFSDIQYENIQVIINDANLNEKYLEVDFQVDINDLEEIIIANNMAGSLGLPNADKEPLSQLERKTNYYKRGGAISKLQGLVSGETKKFKRLQRMSEEDEKRRANQIQILKIREHFQDEVFINTLKIPENEINNFISHCVKKGVVEMYRTERYLEIIDVFINSTESFKKLKNPDVHPE